MRAILAAVVLLTLTGCGGGKPAAPAATPAGAQTYDQSTVLACKEARAATNGAADAASDKHASNARNFAQLSDVPALREVAARNATEDGAGPGIDAAKALTAAYQVATWCLTHKVGG